MAARPRAREGPPGARAGGARRRNRRGRMQMADGDSGLTNLSKHVVGTKTTTVCFKSLLRLVVLCVWCCSKYLL